MDLGVVVDAEVEVDVGRTMATGEPRFIVMDLSDGSPIEWRDGSNGTGDEIAIGSNQMSAPIAIGSADVPLSLVRPTDEAVLFTMMFPPWSEPPLELFIAFGDIPDTGWVTNAVTNTTTHLAASASQTSLMVSNGDPMSLGWNVYVTSQTTPEQFFMGVTYGNTTSPVLVSRSSARVRVTYRIGDGPIETHSWVLPGLDEDRYHLIVMEYGQRAWLVGESVPTLTLLD